MQTYRIRDEFIKLGQALKLADLVSDGVEAKYVINDGRRRQIRCTGRACQSKRTGRNRTR